MGRRPRDFACSRQRGWGAKVVTRLAADLRREFLEMTGFSRANLLYMRAFARAWSGRTILQQPVAKLHGKNLSQPMTESSTKIVQQAVGQLSAAAPEPMASLPWGHNVVLLNKLHSSSDRIWYARAALEYSWSRAVLSIHLSKQGYIQVNEQLETNVPGIYALGDVKGGPAFTHLTYDDFRILRTNLLDHGSASTRDRVVPHTIFIDPQFGRVGMSENEARKQGRNIRVAKLPMNAVIRAIETGETRGLMKAIVEADTQQILGCPILGLEGGEIMTIIQVAMIGRLPYTALKEAIFTHPTLAEGLNTLFMTLESQVCRYESGFG